jgi:DUF1009 family protein
MTAARIALIAGSGQFPFEIADQARRQGIQVVGMGLRGWVDAKLAEHVDVYEEISVGELGQLMQRLKQHGVERAVMAGKVSKQVLFDSRVSFDPETLNILRGIREFSVNSLLGAVAQRLSEQGITLLDSSTYLQDALCPAAVLTRRGPRPEELDAIRFGFQVARAMAAWDIGQTVVIRHGVVVAVEALEGTDAAIRRAHQLSGSDLVVVKTASPSQDRRFDLPVIGLSTVETARQSGVACIAIEAGSTVLLDREELVRQADAASLCIIGIAQQPSP